MIDKGTVDRVMEAAQGQITEVVSEFVNLKRRGVNYIGLCPFHNEKTPSFIVSPHKGIYKCFGCGKGGNAVNFLMDHEQISFVEAIRTLGKKFHIPIEEKEMTSEELLQQNDRESMLVLTNFAAGYFSKRLHDSDEGKSVGMGYFRGRGFRDDVINKFGLGYSPEAKDALTREALRQSYKLEFLEKTGLSIVRDDYQADRFRGRVIFPIHSLAGKVIGFGGRILRSDAKAAKYLNSPESEIYHKSRILYGIYQAKQEIVRQERCYLVEGYTDVLSFHQAGVHNVVASSGTALTLDQIRLISRFAKNITIIFDGDNAGIKAALRGIDLVLEEGINVKVLLLPDGEDPDSFARKMDGEKLKTYIHEHQTDFIRFKTGLLMQEAKNDPVRRAQLIQDIVRTISVIPDPIVRAEYVKECSTLMKVEEPVLYSEIGKIRNNKLAKDQERQSGKPTSPLRRDSVQLMSEPSLASNNPYETEEREVLRFLLKYGDNPLGEYEIEGQKKQVSVGEYILLELRKEEMLSANPLYNRVLDLYEAHYQEEGFSVSRFFTSIADADISRLTSDLLAREYSLSRLFSKQGEVKTERNGLEEFVPKVVNELKRMRVKGLIDEKLKLIQQAQEQKNEELSLSLMQEYLSLQKVYAYLLNFLGNRTVV